MRRLCVFATTAEPISLPLRPLQGNALLAENRILRGQNSAGAAEISLYKMLQKGGGRYAH